MIDTQRLTLAPRRQVDKLMEDYYMTLHPELVTLDPPIGNSINPILFSIFAKDDNKHIGLCSLYNLNHASVELGVRIFIPEYWSKGYGTEIVNALCEYAFSTYRVLAVLVKTPATNTRAIKCYEKCGFVKYAQMVLEGYEMIFMIKQKEE